MTPVVSLRNVSKRYDAVSVVDDLSLDIRQGEIVALLGQTGAGKSTILNMIMGHIAPTSGTVRVKDIDPAVDQLALRGVIAVSFQTDRLLSWRTAEQNVALGMEYLHVPAADRLARSRAWLERVKLPPLHHGKYPHQLSGGMRQRVSLARAMSIDPELVLLDESFSQLDQNTSKVLREDFVELVRTYGKTCLLITHRIDDAVEMADRIIVLGVPARITSEFAVTRDEAGQEATDDLRRRIAAVLSG